MEFDWGILILACAAAFFFCDLATDLLTRFIPLRSSLNDFEMLVSGLVFLAMFYHVEICSLRWSGKSGAILSRLFIPFDPDISE